MARSLGDLVPKLPEDERRRAEETPGTSWADWFFGTFLKVWIPLGFLIVDTWIVGTWVEAGEYLGILPSLAAALYLEFLAYVYLWHRPRDDPSHSVRAEGRRWWVYPVEFGRWTPEGKRVRAGLPPYGESQRPAARGPDPSEFF